MQIIFSVLAATQIPEECIDGDPNKCAPTLSGLDALFANVVSVAIALGGIVLFLLFISAGFKYITAGGDPKGIESAKKTLTYAIAGMILLAAAYLILVFISTFTGVDVTNFSIFQSP